MSSWLGLEYKRNKMVHFAPSTLNLTIAMLSTLPSCLSVTVDFRAPYRIKMWNKHLTEVGREEGEGEEEMKSGWDGHGESSLRVCRFLEAKRKSKPTQKWPWPTILKSPASYGQDPLMSNGHWRHQTYRTKTYGASQLPSFNLRIAEKCLVPQPQLASGC